MKSTNDKRPAPEYSKEYPDEVTSSEQEKKPVGEQEQSADADVQEEAPLSNTALSEPGAPIESSWGPPPDPCANIYCPTGSHCRTFDGETGCICRPGFYIDPANPIRCISRRHGGKKNYPGQYQSSYGQQSDPLSENRQQVESALGATLDAEYSRFLRMRKGNQRFSDYMHSQFQQKRNVGAGMLVFGIMGVIAGGTLSVIGGYKSESGYLLAGTVTEGLSLLFLIPGIVMTAKGRSGMSKLEHILTANSPGF